VTVTAEPTDDSGAGAANKHHGRGKNKHRNHGDR
jgi:hypothetical protein